MTDSVTCFVLSLAFVLVTFDLTLSKALPTDQLQSLRMIADDTPESDMWSLDDFDRSTVSKRHDKLAILKRALARLLPEEDDEEEDEDEEAKGER